MPHAILIDWGTTNFRAFLQKENGRVEKRLTAPIGINNINGRNFPSLLEDTLGQWLAEDVRAGQPILMSGMIGSRQGWVEAPYCPCPVTIENIAANLVRVEDFANCYIVPGVALSSGARHADVMRGEEVQIFGALAEDQIASGKKQILCLPGTHSKWAVVKGPILSGFTTSMTGEVYSVMTRHSILKALIEDSEHDDDSAFHRGLDRASDSDGLLAQLFSGRAEALFDKLEGSAIPSYLSGILIGNEIRAMQKTYQVEKDQEIKIVGAPELCRHYIAAFNHFSISHHVIDAQTATLSGLSRILRHVPEFCQD